MSAPEDEDMPSVRIAVGPRAAVLRAARALESVLVEETSFPRVIGKTERTLRDLDMEGAFYWQVLEQSQAHAATWWRRWVELSAFKDAGAVECGRVALDDAGAEALGDVFATVDDGDEEELQVRLPLLELRREIDGTGSAERSFAWCGPRSGRTLLLAIATHPSTVVLGYVTDDARVAKAIRDLLDAAAAMPGSSQKAPLHALIAGINGVELMQVANIEAPLERGNYAPEVLRSVDAAVADLHRPDPAGRIALVHGPVGTGKTWLVRGMMAAYPTACWVNCPSSLVADLDGPALIGVLLEASETQERGLRRARRRRHGLDLTRTRKPRPIVLVIEDGDECIERRGPRNQASVRALLNLSDGLLGQAFDLRVVVTTNAGHLHASPKSAIDPAVLRPGRLSAEMTLGPLTREHADAVLLRLGIERTREEAFDDPAPWHVADAPEPTLAEVYAYADRLRRTGDEP